MIRVRGVTTVQPAEDGLHVPQVVDEVGQDDDVEGLARLERLGVGLDEAQVRMTRRAGRSSLRRSRRRRRCGLERRQQVAAAAADLEHALAGTDEETEDAANSAMVMAGEDAGRVVGGDAVPVGDALGGERLTGFQFRLLETLSCVNFLVLAWVRWLRL